MFSARDSIYDMGMIQINGKKSPQIAKKYGVSPSRVRQYAKEHNLPFVSWDGGKTVDFYVFDENAGNEFANRNRKSPGRPVVPKVPKVPESQSAPGRKSQWTQARNAR
jgi:uncharacterized protein YjcR